MIIKIIGVLIAATILIVQTIFVEKIKKYWIKYSIILLIIASLIFSVFQFYSDNNDQKSLIENNKIVSNQNKGLSKDLKIIETRNSYLENQNEKLIEKVDSINLLLKPFLVTAKRKYPNYDNSSALNLLLNEITNLKKVVSDAKIETIKKAISKVQNGYQIELQFKMTNNNVKDKVMFDVFLPVKSKAKILEIKPYAKTLALFNFGDGYSADRKRAHLEFNISGGQIPNLRINLDMLDQVLIKSNYLTNDLEIK